MKWGIVTTISFFLLFIPVFAFAQSDENVMNQTNSENIVELNETISITEEEIVNATNLENIVVGLNATSAVGLNATSAVGLNATSAVGLNATSAVTSEETEEEPNWALILMGIVIVAVLAGIAVARSRKKQTATPAKGSKTKKFCRKCGSSLDPKSKFCGKCGVSINPKK